MQDPVIMINFIETRDEGSTHEHNSPRPSQNAGEGRIQRHPDINGSERNHVRSQ
jgi:hypothetical protein